MLTALRGGRRLIFENCIVWEENCNVERDGRGTTLRPSVYGHAMDALASRGDEGRGKLR
jgi:hypothetical protein